MFLESVGFVESVREEIGEGSDERNELYERSDEHEHEHESRAAGNQSQLTVTKCSTRRNSGSPVTTTAFMRIAVATAKASA